MSQPAWINQPELNKPELNKPELNRPELNRPGASADALELTRFNSLAARWWDANSDMRPLHDLNVLRSQFVNDTLRASGLARARVLDVGCGGGLLSEALARSGHDVLGIDPAEELIQVAQLHALDSEVEVRYEVKDASALRATERESFDAVIALEMLEHVPDPRAVVDDLMAMLKPGGWLFLSTLNRTPKAFALGIVAAEYILRLLPRGTHRFDRFIKPSELAGWLRPYGMQQMKMVGLDYQPFSRIARFSPDLSINYLLSAQRPR